MMKIRRFEELNESKTLNDIYPMLKKIRIEQSLEIEAHDNHYHNYEDDLVDY
ncbi:MAG: hypothetical protein GF317_10110 [Candidatus Lokiarchaeota archaeon]|nr:hypothetical protein [Candidatus Lokiarchaeota archaeon]